ncbi:MAG: GAF domain-containing protein, partial [Chloroflexi bacterium]
MRRWLIALFAFVGLSVLVIATRVALADAHQDARRELTFYAREVRRSLENGLQDQLTVVEALRAFLLAHDEIPDQEMFDRFAALLFSVEPSIRALQYADETVTIRYIYPLAGNETALGLRPLDHPEMRPSAERAIRERVTAVSDPFELVQGGLGFVVRAPLYRGDRFLGLAQGVFDVPAVITASLPVADPRFDIQIADSQGRRFWGPATFAYGAESTGVSVGDTRWQVTVGWRQPPPGPPALTMGLIWGVGGLSLILILFTLYREMERAVSLEQMVAARTAALTASEKRYRSLFEMDQRILRGEPVEAILPFLCQRVVELFDLRMAWIGFKEPDGRVRPAAAWGFEEGYLETIRIRWDEGPESEGPTGTAIRTGEPSVMTNIAEDPHYAPWREAALARGYRSSAAIPLRDDGDVLGVLNVYAEQPDAFEEPRLQALVDFARHATVALVAAQTRQRLEEREKVLRERNRQLAALNRLSAAIITTLDLETILEEALEV